MGALSRVQRSCNSSRLEPSIPPRTSNRLWGMTRFCGPIWSSRGANWDGGPPLNPTDVGSKTSSPSNAFALLKSLDVDWQDGALGFVWWPFGIDGLWRDQSEQRHRLLRGDRPKSRLDHPPHRDARREIGTSRPSELAPLLLQSRHRGERMPRCL